jgi:hypothetical protein
MADSSSELAKKKKDKVAISGAEVVLLVLLVVVGMGSWVWAEREFSEVFHDLEPNEPKVLESHHVSELEYQFSRLQDERKAFNEQLLAARLEQLRQSATTLALAAQHPELAKPRTGDSVPISVPGEITASFKDAELKELSAKQLEQFLSLRIDAVNSEVKLAGQKLDESKVAAGKEFHRTRALYLLIKPGFIFVVTSLIILLLLFIVRRFVPAKARERMSTTKSTMPFLIVVGALFILFGYQAFEMAGAALVAVVLLLVLLARIPWPPQPGGGS